MATAKKRDRTEQSTEVRNVGEGMPAWMTAHAEEDTSLDVLREYRVLQRVKTVQGLTPREIKDVVGGEGTVYLSPSREIITDVDGQFRIVFAFMFTEFCFWSDRKDQASPAILDRTLDPTSDIARKARNAKEREEPYGDEDPKTGKPKFVRRYIEHLNFCGVIYNPDHPLHMQPIVLPYQRGEFGQGRNHATSMMMRKLGGRSIPMYLQVWDMNPAFRDRGVERQWWGLDFQAAGFVEEDDADTFQALHLELQQDFAAQKLRTDMSEEDIPEASEESDAGDGEF